MSQSDMNIANQGFPAFRADLNAALAALASNSSGATAPSATFPHQFWVDTSASPSVLKQRNLADDAWVTIGTINESTGTFTLSPSAVDAYTKAQTYTQAEVNAALALKAPAIGANWTFVQSGTELVASYNGTRRFKVDSSGNAVVSGNVTAYGTV